MRSLLKIPSFCVLVQLCMVMSLAVDVDVLEKRDNVTLKAPIVAVPSQHWEGIDGNWSTFEIRVGTPAQVARVLPATSWQEVWVIWGNVVGVCNTTSGVEENCGDERGGLFESTSSSTWEQGDQNFLGLNTDLGYSGEAQYGFDTVGLGYDTSEGPTLTHQIIAEIESQTFFFGQLGMGFQPTNFSGYGDPQASFSDTLYSNGTISSMSWSYTAGAYYRLKSVFGQLIFGGVDESRYTPNEVIFTMTGDNLRDIVVTIRSITSTTSSGNTTLMSTPEFAFIDSAVTELWLPSSVCQEFESAFGLTWNDTASLYLLNASTHENLLSLNPSITITLANQKTGGTTTDIVLPYDSFDLSVSPPILENETSLYFPLKRADDETQYTLGRTFLQEAYVTTHYNSRTFNVSQCVFSDDTSAHIVALPAILPTTATNSTSSSNGTTPGTTSSKPSHSHLSGGAIAGIVIGSLIAGLAIIGALALCCLRQRRAVAAEKKNTRPSTPVAEIDSGKRIEPAGSSAYTAQASAFTHEAGGRALPAKATEIAGNPVMHPQELEAEVPLVQGYTASPPLNGVSDSSGETEGTGVSSMSPTEQQQQQFGGGPLGAAELSGGGIRNMERGNDFEVVSPNSPTMPSVMERRRGDFNGGGGRDNGNGDGNPDIRVTEVSPTISGAGVSLSPDTPQASFGAMGRRGGGIGRQTGTGSRFEERW